MLELLVLASCIGSAVVGGVFFAFSSFVMKALASLPAAHGVAAMQRINVVVLNRVFLGTFMGSALLACALVVLSAWARAPALLMAAGLLYIVGSFAVTLACNVPRNERLARLAADSDEAAAYWPAYVREWTRWNHVRTLASIASAACSAAWLAA